MDDTVRAALAKWPNVPDVYGWLQLDLRGGYRIRNDGLAGGARFAPIGNATLAQFIGRNYLCDARGCWFFQNGPQRVYVQLALTPWVFRLDGDGTLVTHTGRAATHVEALMIDEQGTPILVTDAGTGALDDRDLGAMLGLLIDAGGRTAAYEDVLSWLASPVDGALRFRFAHSHVPVTSVVRAELPAQAGFVPDPQAPT